MSCLTFVVAGNSIVGLRGMPQRLPERATMALAGAEDRGAGAARCSDESWLWQDDPLDLHAASICQIGRSGSLQVMLLGDSHSAALIAAMDERLTFDGIAGVAIGYNSCAPIVTMRNGSVRHPNCEKLIERAIEFTQSNDTIETVFLAARWDTYNDPIYFPGTSDALQSFRDGVEETLARFPDRVRVVVLGQVPTQNGNVPSAMAMDSIFNRPSDWALQTAQHMEITAAENQALREAAASTGARFVDLSTALCASSFCAFEEGGRPLYFDTNHLSTHGARLVVAASGL